MFCVSARVKGGSAPKTVIDWVYWKAEDRSKADLGLRGRWSDTSSGHAQETRSLGGQEGCRQQSEISNTTRGILRRREGGIQLHREDQGVSSGTAC